MYTPHQQSHYAQQQPQSVSALYPQARKLQFELKMQLSYLDSGRTGGKSNDELQSEARENLSQLQQLLWQLDSLVQVYPNQGERETWVKKLQQLRNETQALGTTLEQHIYRVSRREVEARERENLLNRRNAGFDGSNNTMYAAQESASLQKSSQMVSDLTNLSQSILGELGDQRNRMKNVRTKLLDMANRLGLSSSLLRIIERRDTVDFWIVIAGMIFTLLFLYGCYAYSTRA
uniref:t-SNARE coiled-coil homology domain-containing protein n=1 Tax=Globisporangium ultimum (strain ATCC 200006 / CBS 805.95 / DAOM BR144) TaxID=431595 RepID=K3WT39_GLOUD